MVQQDRLAGVLSEFARTLTTDFPIQGILDHLVGRIVDVLPVSGAGVTLISEGTAPHLVAASDPSALLFEQLQSDLGEGPCLQAYRTGASVSVPDLAADGRFGRFGPPAVAAGLAAVWTFPLRHEDERLGALDLYNDRVGGLADDDMAAAQTLADVAAAYLLNARARQAMQTASEGHRHRSLHDPLTGLPNRALLEQRLEHAGQRAQRSHRMAAVLFADLDGFKLVNDTYGHDTGDQLLLAVARRLSHLVRPGDTLARVSGDEFVSLCEDLEDVSDAEGLERRIDDAFSAPFWLGAVSVEMSASVGMAFAGRGEAVTGQLLLDADVAMYERKRTGWGGHRPGGPDRTRATEDWADLARDLREAVARGRLATYYQPVVRLPGGEVVGVEALLRWDHPDRGWVPPEDIVVVAERSGLIHQLGAAVLEQACRDRARWLQVHPSCPLDLAVNVSVRQLQRADFLPTVLAVLDRTRTDPHVLVLEITENVLVDDSDYAAELFARIRSTGIRLALDDFGTGYSSLSYLRRLPVDIVKIDRTFVADTGDDASSAALVAAIVQLAHVLDLSVTAEGVETEPQRRAVAGTGCESAQGFLLSRPLTAEGVSSLLAGAAGLVLRLPGDPLPEARPSG